MNTLIYTESTDRTLSVTGLSGEVSRIVIPSEEGGLPVRRIASHAFAGQQGLLEIEIEDGIAELGSYAFYNCRNLGRIGMTDSITEYNDGVIRMCQSLQEICIAMKHGNWRLIKDLAGDSDAELFFRILTEGGEARLTFPGYFNEYREDTRARAIHQSIVGAGYSYRQCISRNGIDFEQYDDCFPRISSADTETAGLIALDRLGYPYQLSDDAEAAYLSFLENAADDLLPVLACTGDTGRVRVFAERIRIPQKARAEALRQASDRGYPEICSILMDEAGRRDEGIGFRSFSLDDL